MDLKEIIAQADAAALKAGHTPADDQYDVYVLAYVRYVAQMGL